MMILKPVSDYIKAISPTSRELLRFGRSKILSLSPDSEKPEVSIVAISEAPTMRFFINHQNVVVILDTGAGI